MALSYVRTLDFTVSKLSVLFNDNIDEDVGVSNVTITSSIGSVTDPDIVSITVENDIVTITFLPLFPGIQYKVTFSSTSEQSFQTVNGEIIVEDGNRNSFFVTSPGEEENDIRDAMYDDISTLYEVGEQTLVRDLVGATSHEYQKASDAIETTRSSNYLSILVTDELKTRGDGPIDRLDKGGAFEILRVASTPTGSNRLTYLDFNSTRLQTFRVRDAILVNSVLGSITSDPISLQAVDIINEKVTDDIQANNHFNGLTIKVTNSPVIQVMSVALLRDNTYTEYNLELYGYTLKTNRYDTDSASINVNLLDSEIELSSSSITGELGGFLLPRAGDEIYVSYVYKRNGRDVDADSVTLTRVVETVRETTPAIVNKFTISNAPIVTAMDVLVTSGGVTFLNTQSSDGNQAFTTVHPAFTSEIPYDENKFPARIGEYSVNYETGDVFVFGTDINNDGTGEIAPSASYLYRESFIKDLDFTFNSDRDELAVNSTRDIAFIEAKISFGYEDTFAQNVDFTVLSHVEVLNERINNNLISDFTIETENFPISDVFRILNETTGEIYQLNRFNDTSITFTGRNAPRQLDVERERASFERIPQEVLLVSDELENSNGLRVFKIELSNSGITNGQGMFIGSNLDTSVLFSDDNLFAREFFYEDRLFQDISTNIDRMNQIGDYQVDYNNGIVYVIVSGSQGTDLGDITYQYKKINTQNNYILGVNNIYRSTSSLLSNVNTYGIGTITDTGAVVVDLEQVGSRFVNNTTSRPLIVGTHQSGENGITTSGINVFTDNSAIFTSSDIGRSLLVGSSSNQPTQQVLITGIINDHEVTVTPEFNYTKSGRVWVVLDLSTGAPKTIALDNNIVSVNNIYTVSQLGTLPAADLDGYFDINIDSISGNTITLGSSNQLQVGDAIIVNYNPGNIYIDYKYLKDELVVSYEYGNNSLGWDINSVLNVGDEYYVTYKYGALRDPLLMNFGSLTQIPQLTNFSHNLNREVYRSILGGTLQSFIEGPTIQSIERLVEAFTDVSPNIDETIFNNWVLGRDNLHLRKSSSVTDQIFDLGRFDKGIVVDGSQNIEISAISHLKLNEGTLETWVRPSWNGLSNDSDITFSNLLIDGYLDTSDIYIGFAGNNPTEVPFTLNIGDTDIPVSGEPSNIQSDTGFFIWFDEFLNKWNIRWRESTENDVEFSGTISTSGEFHNIAHPSEQGNSDINEITDVITSTINGIDFNAFIDGYDSIGNLSLYSTDGISFSAGDLHYVFDMAAQPAANRISLFKDGTGYLNFQVFDHMINFGQPAGLYNISTNIRNWLPNSLHHVAISWKFNSDNERDEMHLFVDGEEVTNLFKYGGNPKADSTYDFGDISEETITTAAPKPIVGGTDGSTISGSVVFTSLLSNFTSLGINVGDQLYILDDTADGIGDPNFGTAYTVSGVGTVSLELDRAPTLTLGSLSFTINPILSTVTTLTNIQDFIVVSIDTDGNETELHGIDSTNPDYVVSRGANSSHVIEIRNRVELSDSVLIRQLGLILKRFKERVYVYDGDYDKIRLNSAAPVSLSDVSISAVILDRISVTDSDGYGLEPIIIGEHLYTKLQLDFDSVCQPSNQVMGRRLSVNLSGDNFNYSVFSGEVIINGETYSGAVIETLSFTESRVITTSEYWTSISSITVSVVPIDTSIPAGSIEIIEYIPITISENNGDYAEVVDYTNGVFTLETYGTAGQPFLLNGCTYEVDYPSFLKIRVDSQPDTFFIGSDYSGNNRFDGVIDEFRVLNYMSEDTRVGEPLGTSGRSITTDYNATQAFESNSDTLFLGHFNDNIEDSSTFTDRFNNGFEVAPSVNSDFGTAIKLVGNTYIISNAESVFNADEGTIEFWVNPLDDSKDDPNLRYYVDFSSIVVEEAESTSGLTVTVSQRIRNVESVRLLSDVNNTGIDYFIGGSVSNTDFKTITLGAILPSQNVDLKISYTPLGSQTDRVSIFRDTGGKINFFVQASGVEHIITVPMSWDRHTWHRIMVMWKMNSTDNQDRLRLFVDGVERGSVRYGTGLIYGTGIVYGQEEVRSGVNRFLVDNIDLTDTFSKLYVGTDIFGLQPARALIDNLRFSTVQRLQGIKIVANETIDINWSANTAFAIPVVVDTNTSALYDFDTTANDIEFLSTVVNADRGIFRFKVEVIDSFDKVIGNTDLENLLIDLINIIKPSHTESVIVFKK